MFVVDVSKSMTGKPLEDVNNAISTALSKLSPGDSFNIITFSDDTSLFSTSMELVTPDAVERGIEWMNKNFAVSDGTNMLPPLEKVFPSLICSFKSFKTLVIIAKLVSIFSGCGNAFEYTWLGSYDLLCNRWVC